MRAAVVGAGTTGLFLAVALARRGHEVTVVDRDTGPGADGAWLRRGVMQFHHPHGFRAQVLEALAAEAPEVLDTLLAAGATRTTVPGPPGTGEQVVGLRCRRLVLERALRAAADATPGVALRTGHVDRVEVDDGRAVGLRVDGGLLDADLVVDAAGRADRLGDAWRAPAEGGDCGMAYVSRQYRLRPGAEPGPTNAPPGYAALYPGYLAIVFVQDAGTISVLLSASSGDLALRALREEAAFDAAARVVPGLDVWTDPERTEPITPLLPGGRLHNTYRGQLDAGGRVAVTGLLYVGDTVCTTNPTAGRGVTTGLLQARRLLALLEEHPGDATACAFALDAWCTEHVRPWFDDHVDVDREQARRWAGADVDLRRPLPSDLVVAAAEAAPQLMRTVGPYLAMQAPPASLAEVEPQARALYASGWRPSVPRGPTRDELAAVVAEALAAA